MKTIIRILLIMAATLAIACSPSSYDLGDVDVTASELKEGTAYTVTKDPANENRIIMKSLMPRTYQHFWIHPQGRSQLEELSIVIPFPGEYDFTYGVMTRGGIVEGAPYTVSINSIDEDYISGDLWVNLAGGYGNSKTWYLDLDENGVSKYWSGPLYFYGTDDWWGNVYGDENPYNLGLNPDTPEGEADSWSWLPDWPGNTWLMSARDYGYMTFSLIDSPDIYVDQKSLGRIEEGTFMIDEDNLLLQLNGATQVHDSSRDTHVETWEEARIFYLDKDVLQLGVIRKPEHDGILLLVYNYVSKEYYDSH